MSKEFAFEMQNILLEKALEEKDKEIERLKISLAAQEELTMNEFYKRKKAIEFIEYYFAKGRTKNHKQFDLSLYEILTGKNLFNLTMEEIEQFFKRVGKE